LFNSQTKLKIGATKLQHTKIQFPEKTVFTNTGHWMQSNR